LITEQGRKEEVFFDAYQNLLGTIQNRNQTIDLEALDLPEHNLEDLGRYFLKTKFGVWLRRCRWTGHQGQTVSLAGFIGVLGLSSKGRSWRPFLRSM
jgi:hypothetical protein